ncbi:MAG: tRNA (adenosine(37)-N6)-dimethylallyltransferase MiaA [Myxococcales bacterium]|nr:MAG: tRNA (adenosine(37)-N6)-dimethylallyltransferase MiaA [Myxococcales bacterium]
MALTDPTTAASLTGPAAASLTDPAAASLTGAQVAALAAGVEAGDPDELLVVVGPTASGKTALAIELARRFDGEVIGVDSVQVYRRFDLGSGKPDAAERARAPYHLVDVVDPLAPLDAGSFGEMARATIAAVRARGRRPVLCGGTFLWVKATVEGLADAAPASAAVRERLAAEASAHGAAALHERLAAVDPVSAARLHPNDVLRVSRALEVHELTGERLSELHARHQSRPPLFRTRLVGLAWPRDVLGARIAARTAGWLSAGWVDEVRALCADGYRDSRAMGSVGYRQVLDHVEGRLPASDLALAIDRATRVFVRRQMTWLRDEPVQWLTAPVA